MPQPLDSLKNNIASVFAGSDQAIQRVLICLLARGHVLIEDVPGVGKTLLATAIARSIDASFSRVQLTPDMLPADVLGVNIYSAETGGFEFKAGPIFTNIFLADEINRTTPRTQSALLEAMSEARISVDGRSMELPAPFIVIATQNPQSFEGTFPLPENQLDRFLMRLQLGYPSAQAEADLLDTRPQTQVLPDLPPVMSPEDLGAMQARAESVVMDQAIREYVVALAAATRSHPEIRLGLSPRGALALASVARATAFADGRDFCTPEDVVAYFNEVCAHRLLFQVSMNNDDAAALLDDVIDATPTPS